MGKIAKIDGHLFEVVSRFCGTALPFNGVIIDRLPSWPGALVIGADGDRMLVGYDLDGFLHGNPIQVSTNNPLLTKAAKGQADDKSSDITIQPSEFGGVLATVTRIGAQGHVIKSDFDISLTVPLFKWQQYFAKQPGPFSQMSVSADFLTTLCAVANDDREMTDSDISALLTASGKNGPEIIRFPDVSKSFAVLVPMDTPMNTRLPARADSSVKLVGLPS